MLSEFIKDLLRAPALWVLREDLKAYDDHVNDLVGKLRQARSERDAKMDFYAVAREFDVQPIIYKAMDEVVEDLRPVLSRTMMSFVMEAARALKQQATRYRPLSQMGRVALTDRAATVAQVEVSLPDVTTSVMIAEPFDWERT